MAQPQIKETFLEGILEHVRIFHVEHARVDSQVDFMGNVAEPLEKGVEEGTFEFAQVAQMRLFDGL